MKKLLVTISLALASISVYAQKPEDVTALKVQLAEDQLQIAQLQMQLHNAQFAARTCQSALSGFYTPQETIDKQVVENAQRALDKAKGAPKAAKQ